MEALPYFIPTILLAAITTWYYLKIYRPAERALKVQKPLEVNAVAGHTKGGYLKFYGLWDWYDSQPKEVRAYLYKSCGHGVNTSSNNLMEGDVTVLNGPDDPYPWSPTKFLCQHALNAAMDKNSSVCQALLDAAFKHARSKEDSHYYGLISLRTKDCLQLSPDQGEVNKYKGKVLALIRNNPGMLQMDIKKRFSPQEESLVGHAFSQLNNEGKIRREKKGRTFQVWAH